MSVVEGLRNLDRGVQGFGKRQSTPRGACGERLALEVLDHQVGHVVLESDVVNGADVRMRQLRDGARFAIESRAERLRRGSLGISAAAGPFQQPVDSLSNSESGTVARSLMRFGRWLACLSCLLVAAHEPASSQRADGETAVLAATEAYRVAWLSNDSAAVMRTLTSDPVLLPSGRPAIVGAEAVQAFWWPAGGARTRVVAMALEVDGGRRLRRPCLHARSRHADLHG